MCEPCRTRTRRGARKRRHGIEEASDEERENHNNAAGGRYEVKFKKLRLLFQGVPVASVEAAEQSKRQMLDALGATGRSPGEVRDIDVVYCVCFV